MSGRLAVHRLVAAALLVVMGALAVAGSFGAFWEWPESRLSPAGSTNGWQRSDGATSPSPGQFVPLHGISLMIGALLAVAAAIMLVATARRADDPATPRLVGVGSSAFLLGGIGAIWHTIAALLSNSAAQRDHPDSEYYSTYDVGLGAWLLLAAGVIALVVVGLLLTPRRRNPLGGPPPGSGFGAPPSPHLAGTPVWAPQNIHRPGWAGPSQPGPPPGGPPSGGQPPS